MYSKYMVPKAKGLFIELKYQKFQVLLTKMTVKKKKNDQMLWIVKSQMKSFKDM